MPESRPESILTLEEQALLTHCEEAYAGYPGVHVLALCRLIRRLEAELGAFYMEAPQ